MTNFFVALLPYIKLGIVLVAIIGLSLLTKFIFWNGRSRKDVSLVILLPLYTIVILVLWGIYELFHVLKDKKFDTQYLWYILCIIIGIGIIWAIVKNWKDFSVWKLLGWVLVLSFLLPLGWWIYLIINQPKEQVSHNFTEDDYKAKDARPGLGNETPYVKTPKAPDRKRNGYIQILSFRARHVLTGGELYQINMGEGGFNIIPENYGVWYTFTLRYVNDPSISHTMSVMQKEGERCVHERIVGDNRPQGLYYITPSQDVICEIAAPENHPVCN